MEQDKLVSEAELLRSLGLKKGVLASMRNSQGLPFVKVSKTTRFYLLSDILDWAKKHRVIINPDTEV